MPTKKVEQLIRSLQLSTPSSLGTLEWLQQHSRIVKLAVHAVQETALSSESLHACFVEHNKVQLLVNEVICVEQWRRTVFETLSAELQDPCATKSYAIWYHETCALKLLEIMAFHKEVCQALENVIIDLVDYCFRTLSVTLKQQESKGTIRLQAHEDLVTASATSSLSILRYIASHQDDLPEGVSSRMLRTIDVPALISQLIQRPFWVRSTSKGTEVYDGGLWRRSVKDEDDEDAQLHSLEGQAWVLLLHLLSGNCSHKYEMTESRKRELMKLQRYLTVLKADQLPSLKHLQTVFTHLNFDSDLLKYRKDPKPRLVVLEAIPDLYNSIANYFRENREVLRTEFLRNCSTGDGDQKFIENLASLYLLDDLCSLDPKPTQPDQAQKCADNPVISKGQTTCALCGADATYRCSQCRKEYYCGRKCQEDHWLEHQRNCKKGVPKFIDLHA